MADDPQQDTDEEARRRLEAEEEMERLLLAQEHEEQQQQDDAVVGEDVPQGNEADIQRQEEDLQVPQYSRPRIPYTRASFVAAVAVIYHALRTRQQWYLALQYLTSSKWAYIVLGNALIALCVSTFQFFTSLFLQGLRLAEAEGLGDFFRWNVTETCLALTMFRSELEVETFLIFLLLILAKCLHWVADMREGHLRMTQEAVVPRQDDGILHGWPTIPSIHLRLFLLLNFLIILDVIAVAQCGYNIAKNGPSVAILFGFETAILLVTAMSNMILWYLHVLDGLLHYLHDHTSQQHWVHSWLHAWKDRKATLTFAVEVQAQGAKFLFYVTFFCIVLTYYGLPINLFREVYLSFQKLRSRLMAFIQYRRLMASMDRFESLRQEEELEEAGRVCIICRDEMTLQGCKRLPGCGHVFHKSCLREWLVQQQSCPTCRGDIAAMEARARQQRQQEAAAQQRQEAAAAAAQPQQQDETPPVGDAAPPAPAAPEQAQSRQAPPELTDESATKKSVRVFEPSVFVFPSLYRVTSLSGAQVWNQDGLVHRTVPYGTAILCTQLQWMSFNGRSGMMLQMPDGWVREDVVERMHAIRLPAASAAAASVAT